MHVAFSISEAGAAFQTFSPDKPSIFVPWTTIVGKPKPGELEHGNGEVGHGIFAERQHVPPRTYSSTARKVRFALHINERAELRERWGYGTSLGGLHPSQFRGDNRAV